MRYGIFSDVHSNLEALESVLQAYSSEHIDGFFCVGDIVGYGANPVECINRVRALPAVTIAGNHDWAAAGVINVTAFNPLAQKAVAWTADQLDSNDVQFLEELRLEYQEDPVTLVHASLDSPAVFNYLADTTPASESFALMKTQLCFVGHTHGVAVYAQKQNGAVLDETARAFTIEKDTRYIVNIGSVGQPRDGDSKAAYCIFDSDTGTIEIKRVAYDKETARTRIIDAGLPAFFGDRLLSGR
jgi:diadenosine tetraphosphatase ApaH/serine/threonine PP2A family protein phosphatase